MKLAVVVPRSLPLLVKISTKVKIIYIFTGAIVESFADKNKVLHQSIGRPPL